MSSHEAEPADKPTDPLGLEGLTEEQFDRAIDAIAARRPKRVNPRDPTSWPVVSSGSPGPNELVIKMLNNEVTKGLFRKAFGWAALVGAAAGAAATIELGSTKHGFQEGPGETLPLAEGQLFQDNVLAAERFFTFTVGDKTIHLPDLRTLTYGDYRTYTIEEKRHDVVTGSTVPRLAANPYSPDLKLTGEEESIDRVVATELIDAIKWAEGTVNTVIVEGIASDDFRGTLGTRNPEQERLAKARADVAVAVLKQAAEEQDVTLPKEIAIKTTEAVLNEDQIKQISAEAAANGMSVPDLLAAYNNGQGGLPKSTNDLLGTLLERGANYTIGYSAIRSYPEQVWVPKGNQEDLWKPWMSFALVGSVIGYLTGAAGAMSRVKGIPRRRRKLAKKIQKAREAKSA